MLKEEKSFDIPLKAKLYNHGITEVRVVVEPSITLGNGNFDVGFSKGGAEVKHNIASGTNVREKVEYDVKKKKIETEIEINYDRTHLRINNLYSMEDPELTKTFIFIGKSHTVADGLNISYGYAQELDRKFKPSNQSLNLGVDYEPDETWRFGLGAGVLLPKPDEKLRFTASGRTAYRF